MDEYISRNEALNLIMHNDKVCHYADERYENVVYATAQTICKVVADIPAADVQPVKRGKWENKKYDALLHCYSATCSECGYESTDHYSIIDIHRYCEYCGAKMDGDAE